MHLRSNAWNQLSQTLREDVPGRRGETRQTWSCRRLDTPRDKVVRHLGMPASRRDSLQACQPPGGPDAMHTVSCQVWTERASLPLTPRVQCCGQITRQLGRAESHRLQPAGCKPACQVAAPYAPRRLIVPGAARQVATPGALREMPRTRCNVRDAMAAPGAHVVRPLTASPR
eukprot:359585-Chlamydomonas_euryale.AAC.5